jgi:hypothetical protein
MAADDILDLDAIEVSTEPSLVFTLDGRDWHCKNRAAMPSVVVERLMLQQAIKVEKLWHAILIPSDADDFIALLERDDSPLNLERMEKLSVRVAEAIFNRPTVRPASSGSGSRKTRATSKGNSSSAAKARQRSAS